jgi:uncharacterized membrane protein
MRQYNRAYLREVFFRTSVLLKGLDALLEIIAGVAIWILNPAQIVRLTTLLTHDELSEDPHDVVANYLRHAAGRLSLSSEHFMALYLLSHGIVKLFAVVALLKNRLWGYPLSIVVFGGFVIYQIYRFTLTGAIGLIALTIFDLVVIWLIWLEYRAVRAREQ